LTAKLELFVPVTIGEKALEEALRGQKRQAAPFSRGKRKKKPKRPGRKRGAEYGKQANSRSCRRRDSGTAAEAVRMRRQGN
jgi:hypothetical protein